MRVLAVGNMYPPHYLGGYDLVWRSAMRHLVAEGHDVRVLTSDFRTETLDPDDAGTFRELRWYWKEYEYPLLGLRERVALERSNAEVFAHHLAEHAPQVISWWSMGGMSLSLLERARAAAIPGVAFVADPWLSFGPDVDQWIGGFRGQPVTAKVAQRLTGLPTQVDLEGAAHYVFVSEAMRHDARAAGLTLAGSEIVHHGIDPAFLEPQPEHGWGWRLLYVGRLDSRKGAADAITSLAALHEPAASLTIAGGGDPHEVTALENQVQALGIDDRVSFVSHRTHAELRALYGAADVLLFPVRWEEPWGLVGLEAMACGRPVVGTGLGGSGEYLVDGENGLVVEPRHPDQIAAAVRRLASDDALRRKLVAGGRQTASGLTEPIFNARVEALLRRAAGHDASAD